MAAITYEKIVQSLQEKKFQPVYFLHGTEPYFIDYLSDYIEEHALNEAEKSFNQVVFYGKDTDVNTILNAVTRYPMMSQYQVVIVKEAQDLKNLAGLEKYFEKPVPTTILVMCHKYKSLDKRLKVTKILEQKAILFESKPIPEAKVPEWVEKYLERKGYKSTHKAGYLLAEYVGSNLEKLSNALEKITSALDKGSIVDEEDIKANVGISREYNIFELSTAIVNKDVEKVTKLVNYINDNPKEYAIQYMIVTLYNFFSKATALYMSGKYDKDTLRAVGIMEWASKDYQKAVQVFGKKLKEIMKLIQQYDLRSKGVNDTGTDSSELMKEMIFRILYL
jgi:DNA polymerase III subunit delta